jgi:hypothetical protein
VSAMICFDLFDVFFFLLSYRLFYKKKIYVLLI